MNDGSWTGYFLTRQTSWSRLTRLFTIIRPSGVDVKEQFFMVY